MKVKLKIDMELEVENEMRAGQIANWFVKGMKLHPEVIKQWNIDFPDEQSRV